MLTQRETGTITNEGTESSEKDNKESRARELVRYNWTFKRFIWTVTRVNIQFKIDTARQKTSHTVKTRIQLGYMQDTFWYQNISGAARIL